MDEFEQFATEVSKGFEEIFKNSDRDVDRNLNEERDLGR